MKVVSEISDCRIIDIGKINNRQGNISVIEENIIPFKIKRIFYIYDIPGGESRGAHAHRECHQFIIAASGSFEVIMDDGKTKKVISLNRSYFGLHVPPGIWAAEENFSSGAICLVFTSHLYNENDYIRNYEDFLKYKSGL